jgi:hypothetical protein
MIPITFHKRDFVAHPFTPIRDIPWIWSVIPPRDRFYWDLDGVPCLAVGEQALRHYFMVEYERQVREEMEEPEWRSEYWEQKEEALRWYD